MFETTMFKQLVFHPDESQILTAGTDRKITYWDTIEGSEIRMMDGSLDGEINSLAMCKSGEFFASAGEDREVKVWEYDTGIPKWRGLGNSGVINRIAIAPNQEFFVTVGADGSIFMFETPNEIRLAKADYNIPK